MECLLCVGHWARMSKAYSLFSRISQHGGGSGGGKEYKQKLVRRATVQASSRYNSVTKETVSNFPWGVESFIEEVTVVELVELSLECGDRTF